MNKDDLLALTPDIDLLINRYESAAKRRIGKAGLNEVESIATSLHISPLMQAQFTLNSVDSASLTHTELFALYSKSTDAPEVKKNSRNQKVKKDISQEKLFDIDCDTVEKDDSWVDVGALEYGKHPEEKYERAIGYRLTNPVRLEIKSDLLKEANEYWTKDLKQSKNFEDCFNCDLSFSLDSTFPAIEFAWEFDKILKQIENFLELFKKNMDPTAIYDQLCKFKLFIQKNYLCPANMQNLSLMIPALFVKYSLDLINLSLDWNWLLGGVLKTLFAYIINFLENIRSLIMPFINCYIGAVNTTFGYMKSIVKALNKSLQTINDAIERSWDSVMKAGMFLTDLVSNSKSDITKKKLDDAEKKISTAEKNLKKLKSSLDEMKSKREDLAEKYKEYNSMLKDLKRYKNIKKVVKWVISHEDLYKSNKAIADLTKHEFENAFMGYVKKTLNNPKITNKNNTTASTMLSDIFDEIDHLIKEKGSTKEQYKKTTAPYKKVNESIQKNKKEVETKQKEVDAAEKRLEKLAKNSIYEKYTQRKKDASLFYNNNKFEGLLSSGNNSIYKTGFLFDSLEGVSKNAKDYINDANGYSKEFADWCSDRMGLNIENEYVRNEYWAKDFNNSLNSVEKTLIKGIEGTRNLLVSPAENLKKFINDFIGNVINAVRNLSFLFDKGAELELKILGELLQLAHLVRLIRLILKLIDEGISSCEDFEDNKENQEVLKKSIEETNSKLEVQIINDSTNPKNEFQSAKIYTKNNKNQHLVDFNDCSELSFYMNDKNPNLNSIYNSLKTTLIR